MAFIESLLWLSLGLIAFTYAAYPLIVAILAWVMPNPVTGGQYSPYVSIVLCVRNEERWLEQKLQNLASLYYPRDFIEVIVCSDGSTDGTETIAGRWINRGVRLISSSERIGKAACINIAVESAQGEVVIFTDARQKLSENAILELVSTLGDPSIGAAGGELVIGDSEDEGFGAGVNFYWKYEKWIRRNEAAFDSCIGLSGALYGIRKSDFTPIPPETVLDDVIVPMDMVIRGRRVVMVPSAKAFDIPSDDIERERRRKVRTLAGNFQMLQLRPAYLNPAANPVFMQFLSHKVLRLFMPLFLLTTLIFSFVLYLGGEGYGWLVTIQSALYSLAFIGLTWPNAQEYRLIRIPSTFLAMNWFATLGFVSFVRNGGNPPW